MPPNATDAEALVGELLNGSQRALARIITVIENQRPGYKSLVSALHPHTGQADVIGITGSPGAGKSTLVDKITASYCEQDKQVGVIAIDPSSPFSGGAVLGDRIRMQNTTGDTDVFFRSMSARGTLGGISTATTDAVRALDAFGIDKIIVETVGAGQNEVDIVKTADTVVVLVPPSSGDDVQMLKAGILEIADVFVVNKADLEGADRTVKQLRDMITMQSNVSAPPTGHHGAGTIEDLSVEFPDAADEDNWTPPIVQTVAKTGDGVEELLKTIADQQEWLVESGTTVAQERKRYTEEIERMVREEIATLVRRQIEASGGMDEQVEAVRQRETDPYTVATELLQRIDPAAVETETTEGN